MEDLTPPDNSGPPLAGTRLSELTFRLETWWLECS